MFITHDRHFANRNEHNLLEEHNLLILNTHVMNGYHDVTYKGGDDFNIHETIDTRNKQKSRRNEHIQLVNNFETNHGRESS